MCRFKGISLLDTYSYSDIGAESTPDVRITVSPSKVIIPAFGFCGKSAYFTISLWLYLSRYQMLLNFLTHSLSVDTI